MHREILERLVQWEDRTGRKPLLISGARGVGKTWAARQFGKERFQKAAYFNLAENPRARGLFASGCDLGRILLGLKIECGMDLGKGDALVILDDIQEEPQALGILARFGEDAPQIPVIAAGSRLGSLLHGSASALFGKVDFMTMHPMTFSEFLAALGREDLQKLIASRDWALAGAMKSSLIDLLGMYFFVGGMPEAVGAFCKGMDFNAARAAQKRLLDSYQTDIAKHLKSAAAMRRAGMILNSIPSQLAKGNKKFFYSLMEHGARRKDYEAPLQWLDYAGLVRRICGIKDPRAPLASADGAPFKLYGLDVGLLCAQFKLDPRVLLEEDRIFWEFNGALAEQYVLQELQAAGEDRVFYWTSESGGAQVGFVVQHGDRAIPVEVMPCENLRSKNLRVYAGKFNPWRAFRFSIGDLRDEGWMVNVPLYAAGEFARGGFAFQRERLIQRRP